MNYNKRITSILILFVIILSSISFSFSPLAAQATPTVAITGITVHNICASYDLTVAITNPSPDESILGVSSSFAVPGGYEVTNYGLFGAGNAWGIGTLAPLTTVSTTVTVYTSCDALPGDFRVETTYNSGSVFAAEFLTIQNGAFTLIQTPSVQPASISDTVSWEITLESTGIGPLSNGVIETQIGEGLSFVSATPLPEDMGGGILRWDSGEEPNLLRMDPGDTVTITIATIVDGCEDYVVETTASWGCDVDNPCYSDTVSSSILIDLNPPVIDYLAFPRI